MTLNFVMQFLGVNSPDEVVGVGFAVKCHLTNGTIFHW